jgi:hypothetical protein
MRKQHTVTTVSTVSTVRTAGRVTVEQSWASSGFKHWILYFMNMSLET